MAGAQNDSNPVADRRRRKALERLAADGGAADVPVALLAHNPRNVREELEQIEGLADTYDNVGVLQSCAAIPADTFRKAFPEHADELGDAVLVVIGGNRRLAAARHAGREELPVLVNVKATTRNQILVAAATENLSREELKPLEELSTIEELKEALGTYEAVAKHLGKSSGWVSQRRRLHNLQPEVREALQARVPGMTIELARDLGKIKDREAQLTAWKDEQRLALARADESGGSEPTDGPALGATRVPAARQSQKDEDEQRQTDASDGLGAEAVARRKACLHAIATLTDPADAARAHIIALQAPAGPDEALELATQFLIEAGSGASVLHLATLPSNDGTEKQRQAALALALAHCELNSTRDLFTPHAQAYLDWLGTHTEYQPADDAADLATQA